MFWLNRSCSLFVVLVMNLGEATSNLIMNQKPFLHKMNSNKIDNKLNYAHFNNTLSCQCRKVWVNLSTSKVPGIRLLMLSRACTDVSECSAPEAAML